MKIRNKSHYRETEKHNLVPWIQQIVKHKVHSLYHLVRFRMVFLIATGFIR